MSIKKRLQKRTAELTKKVVELSLKKDANDTTCLFIYQPNAPAALKKYSKITKE